MAAKFIVALVLLCAVASAIHATKVDDIGRNTLVVLDDLAQRATYSRYFSALTSMLLLSLLHVDCTPRYDATINEQNSPPSASLGRGFKLTFAQAEDDIGFETFGSFQYDSLILFAPKSECMAASTQRNAIHHLDND
jgi:hypothetical protein